MPDYRLSYLVTTYNKLPYLRQVMARLMAARRPDEEIVVCDGGSQDGSAEYLQHLYDAGEIQQFVSKRDKGEAHGFNKAMLMAQGELLKMITDDDAFCYPAIQEAAEYMLANPEIDVLSGNAWQISLEDPSQAEFFGYSFKNFQRWLTHHEAGNMLGLPLLIRRSSLPLVGLFHTGMVQVDGEFTYRITSLNVNLAWYTAALSVRIENPQSNFRTMNSALSANEATRMHYYYTKGAKHDLYYYLRYKSVFSDVLKRVLRPAINLYTRLKENKIEEGLWLPTNYVPDPNQDPIALAFQVCDKFMAEQNERQPGEFIKREHAVPLAKVMPAPDKF